MPKLALSKLLVLQQRVIKFIYLYTATRYVGSLHFGVLIAKAEGLSQPTPMLRQVKAFIFWWLTVLPEVELTRTVPILVTSFFGFFLRVFTCLHPEKVTWTLQFWGENLRQKKRGELWVLRFGDASQSFTGEWGCLVQWHPSRWEVWTAEFQSQPCDTRSPSLRCHRQVGLHRGTGIWLHLDYTRGEIIGLHRLFRRGHGMWDDFNTCHTKCGMSIMSSKNSSLVNIFLCLVGIIPW